MPLIGGDFLEVRDCVFIKGFPSDSGVNVSNVRKYFQEKVGECCVQMTALSKDKRWAFITLKFDSPTVAENVIERFSGKFIQGYQVQLSFWRVPKNMAHSRRFNRSRNSNTLCSRRWDDESSFDKETEQSSRHKDDFSRVNNSKITNCMSRDTVSYNDKEEFSEDPDNFREYHQSNFTERYNASNNVSYKEHNEEYLHEQWSSDGEREERYPFFDGDQTGWDSEYSGGNEHYSEREYYEREEELSYAQEEGHWQEREVDHGRDHYFGNQDDSKDYEGNFDEYDNYSEQYEDDVRQECDRGHYAYHERPFEDTAEESPFTGSYRSEDLRTMNRQWPNIRDYTSTQGFQARNQGGGRSSSPSFDEAKQWPRWETVAPINLTRRRPSDPEVIINTPKDTPWPQNPRTCNNKFGDLTDRRATALIEERPRSDEWFKNTHRHYKDRGRHSASPVNLRSKLYSHRGSPPMDKTLKPSSEISNKTVHSKRGRNSISPTRERHFPANRGSRRSLSVERSSVFKVQRTSPGSERPSQSVNEHSLQRRTRESRSYSPNPNAKVPLFRGISHESRSSGRRGSDLRHSLMLHQQRKYSSFRARGREEGIKHSIRSSRTSPESKPDKSPSSQNSVESSTSPQGINKKRRKYDDGKRRDETETTKRRRKTSPNNSDNASTYSDSENGNSDSTRNKRIKTTSECRKESSPNQKRKSRQKEDHVTNSCNTKRADRLLSDLAVTLAEGNISLRRPRDSASHSVTSVPPECVDSKNCNMPKPTGQSEESCPSGNSWQEQEKAVAIVTEILKSVDTVRNDSCASETDDNLSTVEGTLEEEIATPENTSQLAFPCHDGSSEQDVEDDSEFDSSNDFSEENSDHAGKETRTDKPSPENHDFLDIKKNCTFIVDDFEKTGKVHETNFESFSKVSSRKSETDFIGKVEEGANSHNDQHTTTDESSEEPDVNSHNLTLYQSHVKDNTNCTENDTRNEMVSTNLQDVRMEISPIEENPPKLDVGQGTLLPGDFSVCEEGRNEHVAKGSNVIENCHELERGSSSNIECPLMKQRPEYIAKTSSKNLIQLAKDNSDEIIYQDKLQEDTCTRPEVQLSQVNVSSIEVNADFLKQGSSNLEDPNDNNGKLAVWASEKAQVNTCTEKEECVCKNENSVHHQEINSLDEEAYNMERRHLNPQYTDNKSDVTTEVSNAVLEVPELEDTVNYFNCEEKAMYAKEDVFILEGAKVTQREIYYESDIDHVYNLKSEEVSADDAEFNATNTEQVFVEDVSDTQQKTHDQVGNTANRKGGNMEDAYGLEQKRSDVKSIDVVYKQEGNRNVCNLKKEEDNSEGVEFDACKKQQEVGDIESKEEFKSCGNKAKQERRRSKNFDFTNEEQTYNEYEVYNKEDSYVMQQKVHCSKDGNLSNNATKESHAVEETAAYVRDTEQKNHHVDRNSYCIGVQVNQEKRPTTNVGNVTNKTEDVRCNFVIQGEGLNSTTAKSNPAHIETRFCTWTASALCHPNAALVQESPVTDANKSSVSSPDNSYANPRVKGSRNLVAEDFEHVDMEISSDEEQQGHFIGSQIHVDTGTSTKEDDGYRPYSPSSPTWRSDENQSPLSKDDTSLYSPSHPTNLSEGDAEVSITIEDVSYEDDKRGCDAPVCDTVEEVFPDVRKNNLRNNNADDETEVLHFNQTINNSVNGTTTSSFRISSSPKSGVGLFKPVSLTNDFTDVNMPTKDFTQNRNVMTNNKNAQGVVKDREVYSDNFATDESGKEGLKPLLRCQKRTQSLPPSVSMDAKPKVVYVTAAKTYDVYTVSGAHNKPRIFYATNDKTAGPTRSLSLDTALGKSWPLGENSNNYTVSCKPQPAFETGSTAELEQRKVGKDADGQVEPLFSDGSFIRDAPLKVGKFTDQHGDQEGLKISETFNNARPDGINVLPAKVGTDKCTNYTVTDSTSNVDNETIHPPSKTDEDILPLGSALGSKTPSFFQASSESRQQYVPSEQSLSTDQAPSKITETERSYVSNMSCGTGEIPVTSELAEKMLFASASASCTFGLGDEETSLPKNSAEAGSTVSKVEDGYEKGVQSEGLSEIQQQRLPHKTVLSNSATRSANKRNNPDSTREAFRPSKLPRKPLKLFIPTTPLSNRGIKRTSRPAYLGRFSKKASTSTVTRTSTDLAPDKHSLNSLQGDSSAISELLSGDKDTLITAKDSTNENVDLLCSLSPAASRMNGNESKSPSITDVCPPTCQTGNASPLTPHLASYYSPTVENSNIPASGVALDDANGCSGKDSQWIALKMKRLRKKKEEIEQVFKRECHAVINVVKMLVSNDPRLEGLLQNAVRRSLQEMGRRCVQELEKQARPGT